MSEYRNGEDAIADLGDRAQDGELLNEPSVITSSYVSVDPPTTFEGVNSMATIRMEFDSQLVESGISIYRANLNSAFVFQALDTDVVDGMAVAQTDQGGIFVVGSGVNFALVIGLSVMGVVLLIIILMVVAVVIYFVARPDKWKSTKTGVKKTQMKVKRSFARQV
jgi:hypothetical protein